MRISRSILIFLFISSISSAFYYGLKNTDGNVLKSIQFTMYFLAIKLDLVSLNTYPKLNQPSEPQQIALRHSPIYNPHVSALNDYNSRTLGLYMNKVSQIARPHHVLYRSRAESTVRDLRSGSILSETALVLITIWMLQHQSSGFQFAARQAPPNIESLNNLLFGQPKSKSKSELKGTTSNHVSMSAMPTHVEASEFVKNNELDFQKGYQEVERRAAAIGCQNFKCSFERFKDLSTECGNCTVTSLREAFSVLQGEMHGHYKNAQRVNYGPGITGIDFKAEGCGQFGDVIYVEIKGLVGTNIHAKPTLPKRAKKAVDRMNYQKNFWSNQTKVNEKLPLICPDVDLPTSADQILGLYDLRDVPVSEKPIVSDAITDFSGDDKQIVFINKDYNI